jgi:integrase
VDIRLPKPKTLDPDNEVRALTDAELLTLLSGGADADLAAFIRIATLSGARLESIAQLKVGDCADKRFRIRRDKTKAGTRSIPIHSQLQPLIDARCKGRGPAEWLFAELSTTSSGSRSAAISKRFRTYRIDLDIDDKREGRRGSLVNFHSLRHWFITAALRSGQHDAVVAQVIGHAAQTLARQRYFGGDLEATLRACVEAVRLPVGRPGVPPEAAPVLVDADQPALA